MSIQNRTLIAAALAAVLAAPVAFAQTTSPTSTQSSDAAATQDAAAAPAGAAAAPQKKSWSDVDTDKNGSLSKSEALAVPALGQVFDRADSDADGALTADEYKAYVAKAQGGAAGSNGGGKR